MEGDIFRWLSELLVSWGYPILFATLFLECTLFLGAFVPGVVILVISGFFSAKGTLSLEFVVGIALVATLLGDNLSFWLARTYGTKIIDIPESVKKEVSTKPWIILVFHHTPYTRMFVPAFFGINKHMALVSWFAWDFFSSVLFVLTYSALGYVGGVAHSSASEIYHQITPFINGLALILLVTWIVIKYAQINVKKKGKVSDRKNNSGPK